MSRSTRSTAAATALVAAVAPIVAAADGVANPKWAVSDSDAALASKVDLASMNTKSAQMRALSATGLKIGPISRILSTFYGKEVKFQHVRNVLNQPAPAAKQTAVADATVADAPDAE